MSTHMEKYSPRWCARNPGEAADRIEELEEKLDAARTLCEKAGPVYLDIMINQRVKVVDAVAMLKVLGGRGDYDA